MQMTTGISIVEVFLKIKNTFPIKKTEGNPVGNYFLFPIALTFPRNSEGSTCAENIHLPVFVP